MLLCAAACSHAIVAKPGERAVVQPNGDTLIVKAYGDHRFHWLEDAEGRRLLPARPRAPKHSA